MPEPLPLAERNGDYYRGVADVLDIVREWEFPFTDLVDAIAERLAPTEGHHIAPSVAPFPARTGQSLTREGNLPSGTDSQRSGDNL